MIENDLEVLLKSASEMAEELNRDIESGKNITISDAVQRKQEYTNTLNLIHLIGFVINLYKLDKTDPQVISPFLRHKLETLRLRWVTD